jgi:hypothetical protein
MAVWRPSYSREHGARWPYGGSAVAFLNDDGNLWGIGADGGALAL